MKILLNKKRSKTSSNTTSHAAVELGNKMRKISDVGGQHLVDLYQVYLDEKDASDKYRLIFTINPVCSNILFNALTEVVYKEGSDDCFCLLGDDERKVSGFTFSEEPLTRIQAIRDTEYSNKNTVGLTYLPGIDIFNNHLLRRTGFNCVMPRKDNGKKDGVAYEVLSSYTFEDKYDISDVFNTIRDYQRTMDGTDVKKKFPGLDATYLNPTTGVPHLYEEADIMSFETSFMNGVSEKDGWFGFYNPATLEIPVGKTDDDVDLYVNKLLNDRGACDFVDLFPGRDRFTFVPQKNIYRDNRLEKNWEYCLTYPYSVTECIIDGNGEPLDVSGETVLNPIVAERDGNGCVRNGLRFAVSGEIVTDSDRSRIILQSTGSIHNLRPNDTVNLYYQSDDGSFVGVYNIPVKGIGNKNGELSQYYFMIDRSDAPSAWFDDEGELKYGIFGRFCKVVFGVECSYYFRVFRRLPNFKEVSKDEERVYQIGKYNKPEYDFNSEINKLAFANNIYGDKIAQIVYLDDIDVAGLTDHFERPLSDIYLTIVKANGGHEEWYPEDGEPDFGSTAMTISRAFGKVTSGIDLPPESNFMRDYNVHRIHNVDFAKVCDTYSGYTRPYENLGNLRKNYNIVEEGEEMCDYKLENLKVLEDDISIDREFFLGDMVEFSLSQYNETVLEPVYHRFNTAQREYVNDKYGDIVIDEIYMDDYEGSETGVTKNDGRSIDGNFKCVEDFYNKGYEDDFSSANTKTLVSYPGHLFPEGYYYQPHYRIHLKDVSDKISQSSDTQMRLTDDGLATGDTGDEVYFTTADDYDLIVNDGIVIQDSKNNIFYDAVVTAVDGVTGETHVTAMTLNGAKINEGVDDQPLSFLVFKKTAGIPKYALHYPDTSGKYVWRSVVPPSKVKTDSEIYDKPFTNGAHYRHVGINFFLKRQDPYGYYELNTRDDFSDGEVNKLTNFMYPGRENDSIYYNDAIGFGLIDVC